MNNKKTQGKWNLLLYPTFYFFFSCLVCFTVHNHFWFVAGFVFANEREKKMCCMRSHSRSNNTSTEIVIVGLPVHVDQKNVVCAM